MNTIFHTEPALYHACGYSCDNGIFLQFGPHRFFITDGRYTLDAMENVRQATVITAHDIVRQAATLLRQYRVSSLLIDPKEWSAHEWLTLTRKSSTHFRIKPDLSRHNRIIKTPDELLALKNAVHAGAQAFDRIANLIPSMIGQTEQELYSKAKELLTDHGRRELSFDPIVAINANSAKPHAHPTQTIIQEGDHLLVDAGVMFDGYCSDRTRCTTVHDQATFSLHQILPPDRQKVYDTVLKAHDEAISQARPGMKASQLDAIARTIIVQAGYGDYFVHSLGHGVGLEIHELPTLSKRSTTLLEEGMVFTIEPGIYLPDSFGVRIEDMVVMRHDGLEVL